MQNSISNTRKIIGGILLFLFFLGGIVLFFSVTSGVPISLEKEVLPRSTPNVDIQTLVSTSTPSPKTVWNEEFNIPSDYENYEGYWGRTEKE